MKILHTSDLHIGKSRKLPNYLQRQQKMLDEILRIADEEKVDAVLVAGDIFDVKHIYPHERDMFLTWVLRMQDWCQRNNAKTILIDGNHDLLTEGYTHLRFLSILQRKLTHVEIVEITPKNVWLTDKIVVGCCPARYYDTEGLNSVVQVLYSKANGDLWKKSGEYGASEKHPDLYFIAMVHECIMGSVNSTGWMADKGPKLDPSIPVDYWCLGDIHKMQKVLPNAWYSGSPIQHDFGDADDKRGVLIVDTAQPTEPKFVELHGVTKLATLKEIPDIWPEDTLVRLEADAKTLAETALPATVVATKPIVNEQEAIDMLRNDDLLRELPEVLAEAGLTKPEQERAVEIVRELRRNV